MITTDFAAHVSEEDHIKDLMKAAQATGEDKKVIELLETDIEEITGFLLTRSQLAEAKSRLTEQEVSLKDMVLPWMIARGIKTFRVDSIGAMSCVNGSSTVISQATLREVLLGYLPAAEVAEVLEKCVKKIPYTTLQFRKK